MHEFKTITQTEYEHLYDHITLENMHEMVRSPNGTVIPERYSFGGTDKKGIEYFDIFCIGKWTRYHTGWPGSYTLYTPDNRPSVWRKPPEPYLDFADFKKLFPQPGIKNI